MYLARDIKRNKMDSTSISKVRETKKLYSSYRMQKAILWQMMQRRLGKLMYFSIPSSWIEASTKR